MRSSSHWPRWPVFDESDLSRIRDCLHKDRWSRGQVIKEFEIAFSEFCGCRHALLVSSGTEALRIALQSIGIGPGDEVIVPGLTWPATALAVLQSGAKAIAVDIDQATLGISPNEVESHITSKTRAIIAVHLYNGAADVEALGAIAERHGLALVEDAAQVHGARWQGRALGSFGKVGAFSFHEKKLLPCGEGGCVITDEPLIYEQAHALRDHGLLPDGSVGSRCGGNSRISSISAALLISRFARLPELLEKERKAGEYISRLLDEIPGVLSVTRPAKVTFPTFYNVCFLIEDSVSADIVPEIRARLSARLLGSFSASYPPLDEKTFFSPDLERIYRGLFCLKALPAAHKVYARSIRFPHQYLLGKRRQIDLIAASVAKIVAELGG